MEATPITRCLKKESTTTIRSIGVRGHCLLCGIHEASMLWSLGISAFRHFVGHSALFSLGPSLPLALQDSLCYLAPAHARVVPAMPGMALSPSALDYVSVAALVFPMVASLIQEENKPRVLAGLGIASKLAQVRESCVGWKEGLWRQ